MRRKDREICDFAEMTDVLNRCDTIRLGLYGAEYPHVVPLSFGWEVAEGKVLVYIHSAKAGEKYNLLEQNSKVCVEADLLHRYAEIKQGLVVVYESIIGYGHAQRITGMDARRGVDLLVAHCGYPGYAYTDAELNAIAVYQITLDHITGKRCLV